MSKSPSQVRTFATGANRDTDRGKLDFEAFLSPAVLYEFARYMDSHTRLPDGSTRPGDNWQKGFPLDVLMKSMLRHVMDLWMLHRGLTPTRPESGKEVTYHDALGGLMFNVQAYWYEVLRDLPETGDLPARSK